MNAHQTDFSKGSVARCILDVAIPMSVAQVLTLMYHIVDRIFIGRIPETGTLSLTGVGLCFPVIALLSAFAQLFGAGGAPLCSIQRGEGNDLEAEKIMGTAFSMLLITGAALTLLGLLFCRPILYLFGASDSTFTPAAEYMTIYLCGNIFVMISLGMNYYINCQGFGRTGMMTVLFGAVVNVILDPLFIFKFGMGVRGAAYATVISQFLSAVWVLKFLTGDLPVLKLRATNMPIHWNRLKKILALGMSAFIMPMTTSAAQVICNVTAQKYGGDLYVGVMAVVNSVREIFTLPLHGLTHGAIPFLSYNYGSRAFDRVKRGIYFISFGGIGYALLTWGLIFCYPELFIRIFSNDAVLISAGSPALHIYFFGFFFMSMHSSGQNVFVSLGKARHAMFFSLFRKVLIVIPLTILLPKLPGLGVDGVFWAEPVSNVASGILCFSTMLYAVFSELKSSAKETEPGPVS
jgi:putative MATE family efflux protein